MKKCCKCKFEKPFSDFGKLISSKDGYRYDCKNCRKAYRIENAEIIKTQQSNFYIKNKELLLDKNKEYRKNNKEQINLQKKDYRSRKEIKNHIKEKNKEYLPIRRKNIQLQRQIDLNFKLKEILKSKFYRAIKRNKYNEILGCDIDFFKKWLEYRFDENMNWNNFGTYWQIDHIIPISLFNLKNQKEIKICFHWTNLQPLESKENRIKSNKLLMHYYFNTIVSIHRFNNKYKQFIGYQAVNESLQWMRDNELMYGKNASYDLDLKSNEMDNPQPSS
jgi:hypothetical protein